jgi:signal transduction histidine kinase
MNQHLQKILNAIQQDTNIPEEERNALIKSLKDADKEFEIISFKLDRTEKVKRTTAILLEETIEELEQKRKAVEAQNRELEIESALERIRAVAMGMMQPDDLLEICKVQFNELKQLGFSELRNALIGIFHDEENYFTDYDYSDFSGGAITKIPFHKNKVVDNAVRRMKSSHDAYTEFVVEGDELEEWIAFRKANGEYVDSRITNSKCLFYYFYSIESGNIGISTFEKISEGQLNILKRFRNVFDLAYKRYTDITTAEAQAREARIEVSLERVRAKAMSMHKSEDLQAAVAVVFDELQKLDLGVLRCGISVLNKEKRCGKVWLTSTDQDKTVEVTGDESFDIHPLLHGAFEAWLNQEDFYYELEGNDLVNYYQAVKNAAFMLPESQSLVSETKLKQYCYVAVYNSGGLFAFQDIAFSDEAKKIMRRFAAVFDLTYKRFLDLQKAEAQALRAEQDLIEIKVARKKAEDALSELQATQKQLIQSEKMASLGELTAGIAHEIQNPLNFVNNFSEVSVELIEELKSEKSKPESERDNLLEEDLLNDIAQNLEKINHHGKRADGIVKGMLQHSRSSTSIKEPTDINKLADEYLRLSYHGIRAKDNSFNATLKTDFDQSIGNINIIPQDIGRVILNLITNAFYAVDEKKKQGKPGYDPTVSVSTKKVGDKVLISVTDNGNGIPDAIKEKIFQPFFTTKPTGQGTGLGLSLSYDIVKAHGGELKVETIEGEGTIFIITVPG